MVTRELGDQLRSKVESGDLVQEALVEFLDYGPRIKPTSGGQFRAVVSKIVMNTLRDRYDWFRAKRRDMAREKSLSRDSAVDLSLRDPTASPDERAEKAELEARVRLVLELMAPGDRQVLIRRDWDGESFVDISRDLEISADTARMRYRRAVERLRKGMEALRNGAVETLLEERA